MADVKISGISQSSDVSPLARSFIRLLSVCSVIIHKIIILKRIMIITIL